MLIVNLINNLSRLFCLVVEENNDQFVIKQVSGAKTDSDFKRYNLVTEEEMKGMKWLEEKEENCGTMDTYMDTRSNLKNN